MARRLMWCTIAGAIERERERACACVCACLWHHYNKFYCRIRLSACHTYEFNAPREWERERERDTIHKKVYEGAAASQPATINNFVLLQSVSESFFSSSPLSLMVAAIVGALLWLMRLCRRNSWRFVCRVLPAETEHVSLSLSAVDWKVKF